MKFLAISILSVVLFFAFRSALAMQITIKDVARIDGVRDTALIGYGLVSGLAGSGDSPRIVSTSQSLKSLLRSFDVNVEGADVRSRNVAAVMITATIPAFAEIGDKLDIRVSSMGDARSLAGGTLLLSPLKAPNGVVYALAQGQLTVGGYHFEQDHNVAAKNHATVGSITRGALVERAVAADVFSATGSVSLVLNNPDFTLLDNVATALEARFPDLTVKRQHAGRILLSGDISYRHLAQIEQVPVQTTQFARIVVNERSGIIVSGSAIPVANVVISHGNLNLRISSVPKVSQPANFLIDSQSNSETVLYRETEIQVDESAQSIYISNEQTTIADVVTALHKLNIPTRDIISILEGIKSSGALHAELVIQ